MHRSSPSPHPDPQHFTVAMELSKLWNYPPFFTYVCIAHPMTTSGLCEFTCLHLRQHRFAEHTVLSRLVPPPIPSLQPVDATRQAQLVAWKDLAMTWASSQPSPVLVLDAWPYFVNADIDRAMNAEGRTAIAEYLVSAGVGAWTDDSHTSLHVFSVSPAAVANSVYQYISDGHLFSSVYTVYELCAGDEMAAASTYCKACSLAICPTCRPLCITRSVPLLHRLPWHCTTTHATSLAVFGGSRQGEAVPRQLRG